ncbi:MAG: ParB/RepB/Spo0J family partition protein [Armatimonadota bacterium]|nr:ParB/RepB/Spo0J family partition protein [Armatimonadota bacterium]
MEKRGLGKGLGALIPGADREQQRSVELGIDSITLNPYQPRESLDEEKLQELISSIRMHGVLQPIVVRPKGGGSYELVAGERRLRAARAAGLTTIPAVIRQLTDEQSLQIALIENLQREDINPIDAAAAYRRLIDEFGLTQDEVALRLGKSRSAVANTLRLLNLPAEVRDYVKSGRLSEGHARAILGLEDQNLQCKLARLAVEGSLSVRETERLAREWSQKRVAGESVESVSRETSARELDPNIAEIEARLREIFRTKVNLVINKDRGRIEIEFYSSDDLERILNLLVGY